MKVSLKCVCPNLTASAQTKENQTVPHTGEKLVNLITELKVIQAKSKQIVGNRHFCVIAC